MADNSNGGQYQVSDPVQTTNGDVSITGSVAPTPSGQMPPQPPPAAAPAAAAPNPNAPDASSPNPGAAGGQVPNPQNKNQAPAAPPPQQTRTQKFLSRARQISDEIAGGDPYKTTIDPNTGETTRTRQPLNPRAISLSIIMEALQGGIGGAGEHGPGAVGQAAQAGLKAGQQIADQREANQANQDQQAQTDLRNRQQAIINTLQTRQLAQTIGRQSLEQAQKSVDADSAEWQSHQQDQSSIISQGLSHDDAYAAFNKMPPGSAQVLITGVRPRVDPKTGKPVFQLPNGQPVDQNTPGAYQAPDFTYALVKPTAKHSIVDADGNLSPEVQDDVKYGFQQLPTKDATGKYPANYSVDGLAYQAGHRGTQIAKNLNMQINQERGALGLEPIDISKDTAQDSTVRNAMMVYNGVLGDSNGDHQKAYESVLKSPYAGAAGTIQNWFGGKDAVRHLDQLRDSQNFDSDVVAGTHPLVTLADASEAEASTNPQVQAAGKAARARINQEETAQRSRDAYATAGAEVWKEEKVAEVKARLAQQGGTNNPYFNETPDPTTGLKENYLNSLSDGQLIRNVIRGTADINLRTKNGIAIATEAANATNGRFDASKYDGYRTLRKSLAGKQGDYFASGSTALDHLNSAYQSADRLSATPFISKIAQKGGFGSQAQNNAKQFDTDKKTASVEVGKAVEGGVLTNQDKKDWDEKVEHWTPTEFKAGARAMADLIYQRMAEKKQQLSQLAPAGIVTGLHGMSKTGVDSYNQMTGKGVKYEDQALDNDSTPSSQMANEQVPQGAAGKMRFSDGNTYYVDANKKPISRATQ